MGIAWFHRFATASLQNKRSMIGKHTQSAAFGLGGMLTKALNVEPYDYSFRTETNRAYLEGQAMYIGSDCLKEPNSAWVWSSGNKVQVLYNEANKQSLRKWGYVMWDRSRLNDWQVLGENISDVVS